MKTTQYAGDTNVTDTSAGRSHALWADCPWLEIDQEPSIGWKLWDDFISQATPAASGPMGQWYAFLSAGALIADGAAQGGVLALSDATDNEGASISSARGSFKICDLNTTLNPRTGKLWFEARIKVNALTDGEHGFFLGLMDNTTPTATVPITAAGALADVNLFGFHRFEDDGDKLDVVYKANGIAAVTAEANAITLVADTWIKVGFKWDPDKHTVEVYVNGTLVTVNDTALNAAVLGATAGTVFPNDAVMQAVFAVLNDTAPNGSLSSIDWIACAQLRS